MPFAPDYVTHVLNENFEDAKTLFLSPLLSIHYAHLVMLADRGIISAAEARALRDAIDGICEADVRRVIYDGSCEDLFFYVDRLVVEACGVDVAGRLHTARSRNDIDMTMYRMRQRSFLLDLVEGVAGLRRGLTAMAAANLETVFPAHTHTQPAQPSTVAHYLLAAVEQLERDTTRLRAAYATTNRNPLGACAITGTGFPIDRHLTSDLLGFDGPTGNTYGSIATIDFTLESLSSVAVLLVGLGRLVQDLLLWCTMEVGYLRLPDGFVQGSSIMPQKRNPVALEHARAIASKAFGQATAVAMAVHNTPFGDIVDTEDDLQPLVASAFRDAGRAVRLVAAAMAGATFNRERMRERAGQHWISITELADTLVRDHGLSFGEGHRIAGLLIERHRDDVPMSATLTEVSREVTGTAVVYDEPELQSLLSPEHFVAVRTTLGGPAPQETARAAAVAQSAADDDEAWLRTMREHLAAAEGRLRQRVVAL